MKSARQIEIWIFALALLATLPFLGQLEFLRHTEADRSIIAWEMLQSGNWLLPNLYHEPYLTKPPLFYACVAVSFWLFGEVNEWTARFPSALAFALLLALSFRAYRRYLPSTLEALLSIAALACCAQVFSYSAKAEIDMLYMLLCTLTLFSALRLSQEANLSRILLTACFLGAALLCKGPLILLFYLCGSFGLVFLITKQKLPKFVSAHIAALTLGLLPFLAWLAYLHMSGAGDLSHQFSNELLRRFVDDSDLGRKEKPLWYYLLKFPLGLLPISLLLPGFLSKSLTEGGNARISKLFCYFACSLIVGSLLVLSLSSGKAGRYILPLYPFALPLLLHFAFLRASEKWRAIVQRSFTVLLLCLFTAGLFASLTLGFKLYPTAEFGIPEKFGSPHFSAAILLSLIPALVSAGLALQARLSKEIKFLCCLLGLFLCARLLQSFCYAPIIEASRSALPARDKIIADLDGSSELFVLENFERWLPFYLMKEGIHLYRLSPERAQELRRERKGERIFLLLNVKEELWRLELISPPSAYQELGRYPVGKSTFLLLNIAAERAFTLKPQQVFPTMPTQPFEHEEHQVLRRLRTR